MSEINFIQDFSHKQLKECPKSILQMSCLKMLYLEGNDLTVLPTELFVNLSQLNWLDVRNNRLKTLPTTIKDHPSLETILLQNNDVEVLPLELGFVPNLKILQVSGNPIVYPKMSIVEQGLNAIADFLRNEYNQQHKVILEVKDSEDSFEEFSKHFLEMPITRKDLRKIGDCPRREKKLHKSRSRRNVQNKEKECAYLNSNKYLDKLPRKRNEVRIEEQYLKDLWMKKLKDVMIKQEELLQRERDLETLDEWRHNVKHKNRKCNLTYRPDLPYDSDPAFDRIPSRYELECLSNSSLDQRILRSPKPKNKINVEKLISDIIESLKRIENEEITDSTPRTQMSEAGNEIKRILDLQKRLSSLKLTNSNFT